MKGRVAASSLLMVSLTRFYSQTNNIDLILPHIHGESPVSLRLIDWFVTNYAKNHNVVVVRHDADGNAALLNVNLSYRAQLKAYSKQQFDPFRRRNRIAFYYKVGAFVETTVGQLNFFRWMIENDLLQYVYAHAHLIEGDMMRCLVDRSSLDPDADADADSAVPPCKPGISSSNTALLERSLRHFKGYTKVSFD